MMAQANDCKEATQNPMYDVSTEMEAEVSSITLEDTNDPGRLERMRTKSLLCILAVGRETIELPKNNEDDAVLIDDNRKPTKEDAIIDLSINSKALRFLNIFLLITLQRIPRRYSKKGILISGLFLLAQVIAVLLLLTSNFYDFGIFGDNTLMANQLDNTVTSVKNILSNLRFPLLYVIGILYFRKRHFEKFLSELRLTRRYWKHCRRVIAIAITMMFLFSVLVPVICKATQMSLSTKSSPDEHFTDASIISNCFLYICVRAISLSIVLTFVMVVYLIYYQIRLFKEQVLKCPYNCKSYARDAFVNIKHMIKGTERYFQPFLVVHLIIFLVVLIPIIISAIERFETESSYIEHYQLASKMTDPSIKLLPTATPIPTIPTIPSNCTGLCAKPGNVTRKQADVDNKPGKQTTSWEKRIIDYKGIGKVILEIVAQLLEILFLYSLPIILLGKVDKCIKSIKHDIGMLKFSEQTEGKYMFQTKEDMDFWNAEIDSAQGVHLLGMSMTSFRAILITLLFPFVTLMFRIMLRHVDINP